MINISSSESGALIPIHWESQILTYYLYKLENCKRMKISIITPTIKYDPLLDITIGSITNQTYNKVEHVIACYKSTVKREDLPSEFYDRDKLKICSVGESYYEGMMKIIHEAEVEILCILNPGEILYDSNTLSRVVDNFKTMNCDLIYGKNMLFNETNNLDSIFSMRISKKRKSKVLFENVPRYTAIFIKKDLLQNIGMLSGKLKFNSEYELYRLLCMQPGASPFYMDTYAYLKQSKYFRLGTRQMDQNLTA